MSVLQYGYRKKIVEKYHFWRYRRGALACQLGSVVRPIRWLAHRLSLLPPPLTRPLPHLSCLALSGSVDMGRRENKTEKEEEKEEERKRMGLGPLSE